MTGDDDRMKERQEVNRLRQELVNNFRPIARRIGENVENCSRKQNRLQLLVCLRIEIM
jgi:hypothetical protein